jgi:Chloroplast import apparatus Tic20-like
MQDPPLWQRLIALLPYSLTWSDALPFGRDLFGSFPPLSALMLPAMPALLLQNLGSLGGMNLGGLLLFVLLFAAVVRNPQVPYTIRFNTLQALMLDILLVVIGLVFQLLQSLLGGGLLFRTLANTVFLGTLLVLLFTVVQVLRGKEADLPTLSEAVRMQL